MSQFVTERPARVGYAAPEPVEIARGAVLAVLKENAGTWLHADEVARMSGLPVRGTCVEVRAAVRALRFGGHPILSGARGFSYLADANAVSAFVRRMESRAEQTLLVARKVREGFANDGGHHG